MKKILLITLLCFGSVQAQDAIDRLLMHASVASMGGLLMHHAYRDWRYEKESALASGFLTGGSFFTVLSVCWLIQNKS